MFHNHTEQICQNHVKTHFCDFFGKIMKNFHKAHPFMKHSLALFILLFLFIAVDGVLFFTYKQNIEKSFRNEIEIAFWKIETKSSDLLSELLHRYSLQKEKIRKRHRYILAKLKRSSIDPLKLDLQPLYKKINEGLSPPPYNIYITDKNLIIKNTTYKQDAGFDLSFAKAIFDRHYKEKTIGVSTPLLEKSSKSFFSYSDSYYTYNNDPKRGILQLSYTYYDVSDKLHELWQLIEQEDMITDVKAYTKLKNGFVIDIKLSDFKAYKPNIKEILTKEKEGKSIEELLNKKGLKRVEDADTIYYFFSAKSPVEPNMSILYHIEFSKEKLKKELFSLYKMAIATTLLGLLILYTLMRLFQKEERLAWQDMFIQSSMHQLKTPLTLIRINNEMLQTECPHNPYSKNIEAGIKTLQNSFEDMHFFFKNQKEYQKERLSLKKLLKERIEYFDSIAKAYEKELICQCEEDVTLHMSQEELLRLIDNNLSNAIKYAKPNSKIFISLKNSILSFKTKSKPIKERKKIFQKYYREDNTQGGHGLGLYIVSGIAKKYGIKIEIDSKNGQTTFSYTFQEEK